MDDEFVMVEDDLPLDDPNFEFLSITVDLLLKDGTILKNCCYHNETKQWYKNTGGKISKKKVIGWRTCG